MKEALNIISNSYNFDGVGGPNKVINNTIKGLIKIGYPFEINKEIKHFRYNWIHDSPKGLIEVALRGIPAVIGPNIAVLPGDLPGLRPSLTNCLYLYPSQWCIDLWDVFGFSECPMLAWPVGIDTDDFINDRATTDSSDVMIYFKRRDPVLLNQAVSIVRKMGLNPQVIIYGEYKEDQYKLVLARSKFGIWIGSSESQGIGLQEALATGLPLIVCDVNSLFESNDTNDYIFPERLRNFKPTTVPYFDERCGIVINNFSKLEEVVSQMSQNISGYNSRQYILENFSIEKQALKLLSFFEILEQKHKEQFDNLSSKTENGNFRFSFQHNLIYKVFLLRNKARKMYDLFKHKSNY